MTTHRKHIHSLLLLASVALIAYFSIDAAKFSLKCNSDGCLGVYLLLGIALTAFIIQSVVLIKYAYRQKKAKQPFLFFVLAWISASMLAIFIPLTFTEILKQGFIGTLETLGISIFMVCAVVIQYVANWF
jgi:hypothetical protein